jgi:hypothetical protein
MKYYIGERLNPQFESTYFAVYGKLSKKAASTAENLSYGSMKMTAYDTKEQFEAAIAAAKQTEKVVNFRYGWNSK